jgi:hypothetical protein
MSEGISQGILNYFSTVNVSECTNNSDFSSPETCAAVKLVK